MASVAPPIGMRRFGMLSFHSTSAIYAAAKCIGWHRAVKLLPSRAFPNRIAVGANLDRSLASPPSLRSHSVFNTRAMRTAQTRMPSRVHERSNRLTCALPPAAAVRWIRQHHPPITHLPPPPPARPSRPTLANTHAHTHTRAHTHTHAHTPAHTHTGKHTMHDRRVGNGLCPRLRTLHANAMLPQMQMLAPLAASAPPAHALPSAPVQVRAAPIWPEAQCQRDTVVPRRVGSA